MENWKEVAAELRAAADNLRAVAANEHRKPSDFTHAHARIGRAQKALSRVLHNGAAPPQGEFEAVQSEIESALAESMPAILSTPESRTRTSRTKQSKSGR
jgi:hypothetical protein